MALATAWIWSQMWLPYISNEIAHVVHFDAIKYSKMTGSSWALVRSTLAFCSTQRRYGFHVGFNELEMSVCCGTSFPKALSLMVRQEHSSLLLLGAEGPGVLDVMC